MVPRRADGLPLTSQFFFTFLGFSSLVHGLVDVGVTLAYWDAVERAGVSAAPLHLLGHTLDAAFIDGVTARN
ncbi:hypothetical protein [Streptomyces sp. KMM 9044]|uniref:hypothetical protein n=1 Tax=Streptomyces sp. KMM 9044 TaxID=2744474 RepID=UPI0021507570|nr:hypothetical protein [Streptomyces sp. KMM 9044]WAX81622.1 hypothetical protein HUV60_032415 [Streptomyces sp. KMM 9044]